MKTVGQMLKNIRSLNVDVEAKIATAKHGKDYVSLNVDQLAAGRTSEGDKIGRYRSRDYARMKNSMNPTPGLGFVDLILTGKFVSSLQFDLNADTISIEADDPNDLLGRYGTEVLGLDKENKQTFAEQVGQTMIDQIAVKL